MHRMVLTAAMVMLPGFASAGSLVSSPIFALETGTVTCAIQYVGQSATPIPLLVTIKEGPSVIRRDNAARLNAARPSYATSAECGGGRSLTCDNVVCAFSFTGDKALFRASACATRGNGFDNGGQVCLPAY